MTLLIIITLVVATYIEILLWRILTASDVTCCVIGVMYRLYNASSLSLLSGCKQGTETSFQYWIGSSYTPVMLLKPLIDTTQGKGFIIRTFDKFVLFIYFFFVTLRIGAKSDD